MGPVEAIFMRVHLERPKCNFIDLTLPTGDPDLTSNFYFKLVFHDSKVKTKYKGIRK